MTAEAISRAVAPLERYADDLRQAQLDYARGEQMLLDGRTAFAVGSGAAPTADAERDTASHAMSDATLLMEQAEEWRSSVIRVRGLRSEAEN
ncbi:hypothetical protein [Actinomycetospora termitidis]|uniref:Uncharacterized protein n=1 Tax=Actinomycetospora termitidis TaxID=3053470 RepID=A0ABT7MH74_9PSEU|nr:hypothetical protein [Actinomycetospora sp. Odt1-22]MDL5159282.1 hypothetical protein [Actinomycetospora sp. Odt1-22]